MPQSPSGAGPSLRRFADFYPFYLSEHRDSVSRRLHFAGTASVLALIAYAFDFVMFRDMLIGRVRW